MITWDEPKRRANIAKHGYDFADLPETFFYTARVFTARDRRLKAIGMHGGVALVAIYKPLGDEALAIISLRRAKPAEWRSLDDE